MNTNEVVVQGRLKLDGTLELDKKPALPPGPVQVTVQLTAPQPTCEDTWAVLERIWAERKALGIKARSQEEIDAQIDAMRNESEDRM